MNQTVEMYPLSSYDGQGREQLGQGVTLRCRAQAMSKNIMGPNNQLITIALVLYVPPNSAVELDYKALYLGEYYKVLRKYPTPNGEGTIEFIKVECTKWQQV